ncbi:hypothetical protein KOW79_016649 [Hemibagrus wyckioides]|uniref:Uncharacterized protein n=1 Tax=Hemibagrus wyckioides TaxID=337641 RepID=A0A9D3SCK9_9TELE|nr:hypothetical protein KOW79_016649 [Hemibagrus wyckioides]
MQTAGLTFLNFGRQLRNCEEMNRNQYDVSFYLDWFRYFLFFIWTLVIAMIWIVTYLEMDLNRRIRKFLQSLNAAEANIIYENL